MRVFDDAHHLKYDVLDLVVAPSEAPRNRCRISGGTELSQRNRILMDCSNSTVRGLSANTVSDMALPR